MRSRSETTGVVDAEALLQAAPGLEVLAVLDGLDPFELGEADQIVLLEVFEKQQRWLAAMASTAMAAAVGLAPVDGDDFVREDVRAALHLSGQTAQDRIDVARALHTTMPATLGALQEGRINYRQVTDLVSATHLLDPDVITRVETKVLDQAAGLTVAEFRRAVAKALLVADPQTAEEQHASAVMRRKVVMYPDPSGMATIAAGLSAEGARTVWLALDTLARANPDTDLPIDARRADALVGLCAAALADPGLPRQHGRPANIQVVIDLPTLLGLAQHPGELRGYGPIPTSVARALAGDAVWQRLVVEPVTGHLLDAGTARYRPNQELADYVLTRSPTCTFPSCGTPTSACDIDHATPFDHEDPKGGGPTSSTNCGPKCRRHHQLKTHGGWTVETHPDGSCTWINPHGRRYHSPAKDHRPGGT